MCLNDALVGVVIINIILVNKLKIKSSIEILLGFYSIDVHSKYLIILPLL